jgi:hypothetical protein
MFELVHEKLEPVDKELKYFFIRKLLLSFQGLGS